MAECIFEVIGAILGGLCEHLGPCLAGTAEFMFHCIATGCVPLIEILCRCSYWNSYNSRSNSNGFDGCFYIALACLAAAFVIGILAMGIYALAQYVQDANPALAAGVACAVIDQALTGLSFSSIPTTFGRNKGMNVVVAPATSPITVYNRCFNNNGGSAKFYVDGKLSAYTKLDRNLYSCTGNITHRFEYGSSLRVLNADQTLLASTDKIPATSSITTFRDASGVAVATLAPAALGGFDIRILLSGSPAASPVLLLVAAAFAQFTSSAQDECNGFVLAGGIIDLILLSIIVVYAVYSAVQYYRKRGDIKTKFYEPDHIVDPEKYGQSDLKMPQKYDRNDWAAEEYRHERAAATAPPVDAAPYGSAPPTQPPAAVVAPNTAELIQFDNWPSTTQSHAAAPAAPPPRPPAFNPPAPAPANIFPAQTSVPLSQSTMSYWEGADMRDKLAPVGYMKLKRFLILHGVQCGNTLLKDELITLAILHRDRIDFSPLMSN